MTVMSKKAPRSAPGSTTPWVSLLALTLLWGCDKDPRYIQCPPSGCLDSGVVHLTDGDVSHDAGADVFSWPDAWLEDSPECSREHSCVIAINFNYCCPCPMALPTSLVMSNECVVEAVDSPERPGACGRGCGHPDLCAPCPVSRGVTCANGHCVTLFEGECHPDAVDPCDAGEICDLLDGVALCVTEPGTCRSDEGCQEDGWSCRDWRSDGAPFCWHEDSTCFDDLACPDNAYCEDEDSDGVHECVDVAPLCRVGAPEDCSPGEVCVDADQDDRGTCERS